MLIDNAKKHALGPWHILGRCLLVSLHLKQGRFDIGIPLVSTALDELQSFLLLLLMAWYALVAVQSKHDQSANLS